MEVVMAKQMHSRLLQIAIFATFLTSFCASMGPEQGIFTKTVSIKKTEPTSQYDLYESFTKSMYKNSEVSLSVSTVNKDACKANANSKFTVSWMIRFCECEATYAQGNDSFSEDFSAQIFETPTSSFPEESFVWYYKSKETWEKACNDLHGVVDNDERNEKWVQVPVMAPTKPPAKDNGDKAKEQPAVDTPPADAAAVDKPKSVSKRAAGDEKTPALEDPAGAAGNGDPAAGNGDPAPDQPNQDAGKPAGKEAGKTPDSKQTTPPKNGATVSTTKAPHSILPNPVTKAKFDGRYLFIVKIEASEVEADLQLEIEVKMKSSKGYLSAFQWPLLPFYGVMCAVYSILAFIWLLFLGCNWRDLLRIQFWICGVLVLGLLEKAIFYAEFENVNKYGNSVTGAIIFAELMSCFKRALARMLLIIVSLGYGITRPRLGRDLHWVMAAGAAYFILSSVEGCLRVKGNEQHALIAVLPLAVLDAVICWWIFKNLVDTTRQLRLRRNLTKLWLYRHLTNTLIVCIVCAVVFLIWSTKAHRWTQCVTKWRELWLDDAYWHVLFCIILTVIMVLIRPTANNQRYAFSPLPDAADDEESQQPMINDAFDSVKMRQMPGDKPASNKSAADDALKWVEDNIPAAVADATLGAFDDSEEELVNTLERNKME